MDPDYKIVIDIIAFNIKKSCLQFFLAHKNFNKDFVLLLDSYMMIVQTKDVALRVSVRD